MSTMPTRARRLSASSVPGKMSYAFRSSRPCAMVITRKAAASFAPLAAKRMLWRSWPVSVRCAACTMRRTPLAPIAACVALGIDLAAIQKGLTSFPGLAHRMQQVGRKGNVLFVNDSKATNADSAAKALASFQDIFWIAGGKPKTGGIDSLAEFFPRIRKAYLIGEAAKRICKDAGWARCLTRSIGSCRRQSTRQPAMLRRRA